MPPYLKTSARALCISGLLLGSTVACAQDKKADTATAARPAKPADALPADLQNWVLVINSLLATSRNPTETFTIVPDLTIANGVLVSKWLCVRFGSDRPINVSNLKGEKPGDTSEQASYALTQNVYEGLELTELKNGIGQSSDHEVLLLTPQDYIAATFDDPVDAKRLYDTLQELRTYLLKNYSVGACPVPHKCRCDVAQRHKR